MQKSVMEKSIDVSINCTRSKAMFKTRTSPFQNIIRVCSDYNSNMGINQEAADGQKQRMDRGANISINSARLTHRGTP